MDKGSDDLAVVRKEAMDRYNAGMFREALLKFKLALAMAEKAGDDQSVMGLYSWIITCHGHLGQVSGVDCERIAEKLTFLHSLSTRKCCVYATRRNR